MRGLLIALMSLTLAASGFAQSRRGSGGGSGSRVAARSFSGRVGGGAVRGGFTGGGFGRGFVNTNRGYVGAGRPYASRYYGGGYGYGVGMGYSSYYAPSCYDPYYGAYNCGYPPYGYYAAPMARGVAPRVVIAPRRAVIVGGGWQHFGRR